MKIRRRFRGALLALAAAGSLCLASCKSSEKGASKPNPEPPVTSEKKLRLQALPAHVGDKSRTIRETELKMSVEYWQEGEKLGTQETLRSESYSREEEVTALVGGVAAVARVRYERYRVKEAKAGEPPHEDNGLEGQTYVVDCREHDTKATTADGKPVAPEVLTRLEQDHAELGVEDKVVAELKDQIIVVGTKATMRAPLFRALATTEGDFKGGSITLVGTRTENGQEAAVFDWTGEMHNEEQTGLETTWHIKGQVAIGVSPARILKSTLTADIDVGGHTKRDGKRVDIAGSGSMRDERSVTPL